MEQKNANEDHFVGMCKKHVAEIERYSGTDPLEAWYRYMVWLEKNYVIDFSADSVFIDILCECLATFESDERYKQDRRMIKLFIKYISYQDDPVEHFKLMHANGVGTRVADLYICWAHWFNIDADFESAEQIYQWGIEAKARPKSLLERAHIAFGANMSKRFLNKACPNYEDKVRSTLQRKYDQFIGLDLVEETTGPKAEQMQVNLLEFHKAEAYAIPYRRIESGTPSTPERQSTTSLIKTIVNSCSARKRPIESRRSLHPPMGSRLDFGNVGYPSISLADTENWYARGIQLPSNFARANLPQRVVTVPPVRDDDLDSTESNVLKVPTYDKIMLMPSVDKSYSPEELMAYKWFKNGKIVNAFTTDMDAVWSVGWHLPTRRGKWLVKQNSPQSDLPQDLHADCIIDCPIAAGIWQFAFDIEQHHPKGRNEEFSREELLQQKRIKSRSMGPTKPSSILQILQRQKMQLPPQQMQRMQASPRPGTSQPMNTESNSSQYVAGRKTYRPEMAEYTFPDPKKNRRSSNEFKELNDTCTTQTFGMFLKGHAVSTPNPKMGHHRRSIDPRCSVFVSMPDAMEEEPLPSTGPDVKMTAELPEHSDKLKIYNDESTAHAMESKVDEKGAAGNLKFEIFTDETGSLAHDNASGEHDAHAKLNVRTTPEVARFEFEIYRDESKIMSEKIKVSAEKKLTNAALPAAIVNDENRPLECLSSPCESFRSMAISSVPPLKEFNVAVGEKQHQISDLNYSFALTDVEKRLICANSNKVDFSFDFAELNKPRMVKEPPLIDEQDSEENDLLGQSIYVPREEVVFSPAKHAEWPEVALHLGEGKAAKNDYVSEAVDMNRTLQIIDAQLLDLMKLSPFNPKLQKALLDSLSFVDRLTEMDKDVCDMMKIVQPMKPRAKLTLGKRTFNIQKMIGSGNFGNVFRGECCRTKSLLAFKQERPPNIWEYYICLEVQKRLDDQRIRNGCMSIEYALIGTNATIFASKFSPFGTLLQVCNKVKISTGRNMDEYVVMIFAKQMFAIVNALHRANLIHADIKPDNFLLMNPLDYDYDSAALAIQLIDFGQSIDMKLFPKNQVFYSKVKTENFVCTEMMDNRPWTFQLDLFCLASTIYTMVCGEYMVVRKANKNSSNYTTRPIPRYYNKNLWTHLFAVLINIPDPQRMPNLDALVQLLDDEIQAVGAKAMHQKITKFNKALEQ